jgi:hypothetical protein
VRNRDTQLLNKAAGEPQPPSRALTGLASPGRIGLHAREDGHFGVPRTVFQTRRTRQCLTLGNGIAPA